MKTANTILLELIPGQTSTDVLGEKLRQSPKVLLAYLADLEIDGLVTRDTVASTITVWRLTGDGLTAANAILQPA
jgi:DNA-binding HxlR family transcriptional regulator